MGVCLEVSDTTALDAILGLIIRLRELVFDEKRSVYFLHVFATFFGGIVAAKHKRGAFVGDELFVRFREVGSFLDPIDIDLMAAVSVKDGGKKVTVGEVFAIGVDEVTRNSLIESSNTKVFEASFGVSTEGKGDCLLYTSPSPRDLSTSRMPSSA